MSLKGIDWKARQRKKKPPERREMRALRRTGRIARRTYRWYQRVGIKFISKSVDWAESEGRISAEKAAFFRSQIGRGELADFLAGYKAHFLLGIIPVLSATWSSVIRPSYTISARLKSEYRRRISRTISREEHKRAVQLHSPEAVIVSAIPFFGSVAYLLSNSVRDPELMQIIANYSAYRLLGRRLYEKSRVKFGIERAGRQVQRYYTFRVQVGERLVKVFWQPSPGGPLMPREVRELEAEAERVLRGQQRMPAVPHVEEYLKCIEEFLGRERIKPKEVSELELAARKELREQGKIPVAPAIGGYVKKPSRKRAPIAPSIDEYEESIEKRLKKERRKSG